MYCLQVRIDPQEWKDALTKMFYQDTNNFFNEIKDFDKTAQQNREENKAGMQERTQIKSYQEQIYYLIPHFTIRLCSLHSKLGIPLYLDQTHELFNCWNYMCKVFLKYLKLCDKYSMFPFPRGSAAFNKPVSSSKEYSNWDWLSRDDPDIVLPSTDGLNMDYCMRDTIIRLTHYLADRVLDNPEDAQKFFDTLINVFEKDCIDEVVLVEIVRAARKIIMSNIKILIKMEQNAPQYSSKGNRAKLIGRLQERMPSGFDIASNELLELTYDYLKNVTEVNDHHKRILNYTLLQLKNKSLSIRSKFFSLFDQYYGKSVYKRLEHIFLRPMWDYTKDSKDTFWIQQDLDLLLSSIDEETPMQREPGGVVLLTFRNKKDPNGEMIDVLPIELQRIVNENEKIVNELKDKKTEYWLQPLKDVTNWEHHICEKLWLKLFPQFWNVMTADEQQQITSLMEPFLTREEFLKQMQGKRPNAIKTMFEAMSACDPLPKLSPEVIQFLGKNHIAWHTALPLLEGYLHAYPGNERYYISMSIILKHLAETDYVLGLQRHVSKSPVTHAVLSFAQFQLWSSVDDLLSVEIKKSFKQLSEREPMQAIESAEHSDKEDLNSLLSQIDFRIWEEWESEAALNLNKWDMLKTLGTVTGKTSFVLQCHWSTHDWASFTETSKKLGNSEIPLSLLVQLYERIQQQPNEKDDERDTIYKRGLKAFFTEWNMFPNIVDAPHYQSIIIQGHFLETNEYKNMHKDLKESIQKQVEPDFKSLLSPWRERLPNKCEPFNVWRDLLECRNFLFRQLKSKLITSPTLARYEQNIHDIPWNYLKLTEIARKHGLIDQAFYYLGEADKNIKESGDVHSYERFLRAKETAKLAMKFESEWEGAAEYLKIAEGQSFCQKSKFALSEIMRLRGELLDKLGKSESAYDEVSSAVTECIHNYKAWVSYAMFREAWSLDKKDVDSNLGALKGYIHAATYMISKSKYYIPKVLLCIERSQNFPESDHKSTLQQFKEFSVNLPTWVWLFWIPQLVENLKRSAIERETAMMILTNIAKLYPQILFIYLKSIQQNREDHSSDIETLQTGLHEGEREAQILICISNMLTELENKVLISSSREDEFLLSLKQVYNKSVPIVDVDDFFEMINQVKGRYFDNHNYIKLQERYEEKFKKDFLSEEAKSQSIIELLTKLRNWADYLHTKIALRAEQHSIDGYSQELATYMPGRIEMFGLSIHKDSEPIPEHTIYITKLETKVEKNFRRTRVDFRGTNERNYNYYLQIFNNNGCHEIFMTQLKVYLNKIFASNRHTIARNVKLHSPFSLYWGNMKMSLDEQHVMSMSDLHDAALIERRLHPEHPSISYLTKKGLEEELNKEVIKEMQYLLGDYIFAGFIHKLVSNPDELFIYKKQFTSYLAAQSFFTYAFKVDHIELSSFLFCKRTGKVNFSSSQQNFVGVDNGVKVSSVPFRLTPNLRYFITPIGIQGPFAAAITAAAYTIQEKKLFYLKGYLHSYYKNVLEQYTKEDRVEENCMRTLEEIGRLLDLKQIEKPFRDRYMTDSDMNMERSDLAQADEIICFNHEVYKKIQEAQEIENMKRMPLIWAPWF